MDANVLSEQLEEGEIVDDDDFEDISDNSIIDSTFGKFVSSKGHLRALSLSSDSVSEKTKTAKTRKLLHRKCKLRHQKRRKKRRLSSDSSDSDIPPPELKGKLKEAIHISGLDGGFKNPLETRLKAMGGLGANTEPPPAALESPPQKQQKENQKEDSTDKIDDIELENLRLEALKTAILNKYQRRKRKKIAPEIPEGPTVENKENNTPKGEQNAKIDDEKSGNNAVVDLEEDEDLLRAALLAGLAKKITKITPNESVVNKIKPVPLKRPIQVRPALPKRPITNFKSNILNKQLTRKINRPKPQVKPLIINVNDDSDSDDDVKKLQTKLISAPPRPPDVAPPKLLPETAPKAIPDLISITSNVEKFLKEQRAKFETETHKRFQLINKCSKDKSILEKSAVKLLPKSQQIEYQKLLQRLKNAEKRKRARKLALQKLKAEQQKDDAVAVTVEIGSPEPPKLVPPEVAVVVNPVAIAIETVKANEEGEKTDSSVGRGESSVETDSPGKKKIINELTTLQKTLKDIKMQKNGSLQIKSKYQKLTPIIRKITSTSNERKKQEQRIKILLQELNEARSNLAKSHERFSTLVRELVDKKETIEKSYQEANNLKKKNGNITKGIDENIVINKEIKSAPVTSTPIKGVDLRDEPTISTFAASSTNNECEDMDVCNSDETDMCQIDIVDPNDIDQIFRRRPPVKSSIPEYVSPLNFNAYDRYRNVDPHGIMCPYEVNGSCRDIDCTYKHYL